MAKILILTFNMSLGTQVCDLLKSRDIEGSFLADGNKGIELCRKCPFDLVIVCEDVGGVSIESAMSRIRKILPSARFIAVASKETARLKSHRESAGRADHYLFSPSPSAEQIIQPILELLSQMPQGPKKAPFFGERAASIESPEIPLSPKEIENAFDDLFADLETPQLVEAEGILPAVKGEESAEFSKTVSPESVGELKALLRAKQKKVAELERELETSRRKLKELEEQSSQAQKEGLHLTEREGEVRDTLRDLEEQQRALIASHQADMSELQKKHKEKIDQLVIAEKRLQQCQEKFNLLRERVRNDLQQIKLREKEIENRLEIVKRDSQTLLRAKDQKVLELKRRIDMLEFDLENLQGKLAESHRLVDLWKERMGKASKAIQLALTLLDTTEREIVEEAVAGMEEFPKP